MQRYCRGIAIGVNLSTASSFAALRIGALSRERSFAEFTLGRAQDDRWRNARLGVLYEIALKV
jgi:hypothetical protein